MGAEGLAVLLPGFAVIAFVYGSVGLGGGSAYVAVMMLLGMDHVAVPPIALALNLVVAGGGFVHYLRAGHFRSRAFAALVVTSAPAAFLAARVPLDRATFQGLVGLLLLAAGLRLLAAPWLKATDFVGVGAPRVVPLALVGLGLGVLAGLTGIGGGVYLAPVLLLGRLAGAKETAALCSGFVVVNSAAGLAGRLAAGFALPWGLLLPLLAVVLVAGQAGAALGARRYRPSTVQAVFGGILVVVALRLLVSLYGGV